LSVRPIGGSYYEKILRIAIAAKFIDVIGDGETARDRWLFGPHCHCGSDCGWSFL